MSRNSSIDKDNLYTRQTGIVDMRKVDNARACIIGCGAIGSMTAIVLAKLGMSRFTLYDDDKVEIHNLPNQYYTIKDIGRYKPDALGVTLKKYNPSATIWPQNRKFNPKEDVISNDDILIVAVDDMNVRKAIFEKALKIKFLNRYIEARMGGESFRVYSVAFENILAIDAYKKTLYASNKAEDIPCTEKAIIFISI